MSIFADLPWLLPSIGVGLGLIMLMVASPRSWLAVSLFILPWFVTDTGRGISTSEVIVGGLFTSSIVIWLILRLTVDPRPLVRGWVDFLLLFFIAAASANVVVAKFNHVELSGWAVDWSYLLLMLYCFPLREEFGKNLTTFRQFLVLTGISSILMSAYSSYIFRQKMAENMIYAYQIFGSRSTLLGPVFLLAILFGVVMYLHSASRKGKLFSVVVILANLVALALTFTRTIWVFVLICLLIAMSFLRWHQNVRIVLTASILLVSAFMIGYAINPKITGIAVKLVKHRFETSTQLSGGDRSFETRVIEAGNAWRKARKAPLGGNGLRSTFVTWAPIEQWHNVTAFVHIGYVGLIHKLGVPTAAILFLVLIGTTVNSFWTAVQARHGTAPPLVRAAAIATFCFMPAIYVNIFMAGFFDQRYGNFIFAFVFASVAMTDQLLRQSRASSAMQSQQ